MYKIEDLKGVTSYFTYEGGGISECRLNARNVIRTKYGDLVPQYRSLGIRRKDSRALSFYKDGSLRSISLDEQTIIDTPAGKFPAELITFFEEGSIDSLFPLNGQISFAWSQEEEGGLAESYEFKFPFGEFKVKISGIRFYPDGKVRSIIFWPGEIVPIKTKYGNIPVRVGFKLYDNQCIESVEPAFAVSILTPVGEVKAYDSTAWGIEADKNSLRFDREGELLSLKTAGVITLIEKKTGKRIEIHSRSKPGLTEEDFYLTPIQLTFHNGHVEIDDGMEINNYAIIEYIFTCNCDENIDKKQCYGECTKCIGCYSGNE